MGTSAVVQKILGFYEADNPGVKANLHRILMTGKLAGTGKMIILPVDQGFEHGPARSFAPNPDAYDPHYHFQLAIDAGLNAFAAPLPMLEAGADTFAGQIPLILKVNSANSLIPDAAPKTAKVRSHHATPTERRFPTGFGHECAEKPVTNRRSGVRQEGREGFISLFIIA